MAQQDVAQGSAAERAQYVERLDEFARDLERAVNQGIIESKRCQYRQVAVFAFYWDNDDLSVASPVFELLTTFRETYGFSVESYTIPTTGSLLTIKNRLKQRLIHFNLRWNAEDALLIYVYAGHAFYSKHEKYLIGGCMTSNDQLSPTNIEWDEIVELTKGSDGDILYIIDACYTAKEVAHGGPEVFTWNSIAGATDSTTSFTEQLVKELQRLDGSPCSIEELQSKIFKDALDANLIASPLRIAKKGKPSIILTALPMPADEDEEASSNIQGDEQRALISIRLETQVSINDFVQWKKWLAATIPSPVESESIKIEAVFIESDVETCPTMILVTLPFQVWTLFPMDESKYNFIALVKSGNILPRLDPEPHTGL